MHGMVTTPCRASFFGRCALGTQPAFGPEVDTSKRLPTPTLFGYNGSAVPEMRANPLTSPVLCIRPTKRTFSNASTRALDGEHHDTALNP